MTDPEFSMSAKTLILPFFLIILFVLCIRPAGHRHHTDRRSGTAHDLATD